MRYIKMRFATLATRQSRSSPYMNVGKLYGHFDFTLLPKATFPVTARPTHGKDSYPSELPHLANFKHQTTSNAKRQSRFFFGDCIASGQTHSVHYIYALKFCDRFNQEEARDIIRLASKSAKKIQSNALPNQHACSLLVSRFVLSGRIKDAKAVYSEMYRVGVLGNAIEERGRAQEFLNLSSREVEKLRFDELRSLSFSRNQVSIEAAHILLDELLLSNVATQAHLSIVKAGLKDYMKATTAQVGFSMQKRAASMNNFIASMKLMDDPGTVLAQRKENWFYRVRNCLGLVPKSQKLKMEELNPEIFQERKNSENLDSEVKRRLELKQSRAPLRSTLDQFQTLNYKMNVKLDRNVNVKTSIEYKEFLELFLQNIEKCTGCTIDAKIDDENNFLLEEKLPIIVHAPSENSYRTAKNLLSLQPDFWYLSEQKKRIQKKDRNYFL
eukprot:g453.t1